MQEKNLVIISRLVNNENCTNHHAGRMLSIQPKISKISKREKFPKILKLSNFRKADLKIPGGELINNKNFP